MHDDATKKPPYRVGYGQPPEASRFRKGRSGNPSGRPKKVKSSAELAHDRLNTLVAVTVDGKRTRISLREAVVAETVTRAVKGDRHSRKLVLDLDAEHQARLAAASQTSARQLEEEKRIFDNYMARQEAARSDEEDEA